MDNSILQTRLIWAVLVYEFRLLPLEVASEAICYNPAMTSYGVTLLSGGLDSTTVSTIAKERVEHLWAITFHYGQSNAKEVSSAKKITDILGIKHRILDISFLSEISWYSALTSPDSFASPSSRTIEEIGHGVPITYVPMRNLIFMSLAAAFLESQVLHALETENIPPSDVEAVIYIAPNALDYSGYPDCRPEFYERLQHTFDKGSKLSTVYGISLKVETPIINLSKAEIAALGMKIGAPLEHTWSCYGSLEKPCGHCDSCILRAKGFAKAEITDPLLASLGLA